MLGVLQELKQRTFRKGKQGRGQMGAESEAGDLSGSEIPPMALQGTPRENGATMHRPDRPSSYEACFSEIRRVQPNQLGEQPDSGIFHPRAIGNKQTGSLGKLALSKPISWACWSLVRSTHSIGMSQR